MDFFRRIHFVKISHLGYANQGDIICSPYVHFQQYFSQYGCVLHSMDSIYYSEIGKNDIIILGGGGIVDFQTRFNSTIKKLQDICDTVIFWGGGHNGSYNSKENAPIHLEPNVDWGRFALYGVRDYKCQDLTYTPCVSSVNPLLKEAQTRPAKRKIGTMFHGKSYLDALNNRYPNKSHYHNIEDVIDFISDSEVIITESYHCGLWATLSNRKVIMPSEILKGIKYNYLRYKPTFMPFGDILKIQGGSDLGSLPSYPDAYDESYGEVHAFMEKVKAVIETKIKTPSKGYIDFYNLHKMGEIVQRCDNLYDANKTLRRELTEAQKKIAQLESKIGALEH